MLAHWIIDGITAIPNEFLVLALGVIMTLLAWIGRNAKQQLDDHVKECNIRRITEASTLTSLGERVEAIESSSRNTNRNVTWLGDCMISLGATLKAHLPERPE